MSSGKPTKTDRPKGKKSGISAPDSDISLLSGDLMGAFDFDTFTGDFSAMPWSAPTDTATTKAKADVGEAGDAKAKKDKKDKKDKGKKDEKKDEKKDKKDKKDEKEKKEEKEDKKSKSKPVEPESTPTSGKLALPPLDDYLSRPWITKSVATIDLSSPVTSVILRRLAKKDAVTKIKALAEISSLLASAATDAPDALSLDDTLCLVPALVQAYARLYFDPSTKVREALLSSLLSPLLSLSKRSRTVCELVMDYAHEWLWVLLVQRQDQAREVARLATHVLNQYFSDDTAAVAAVASTSSDAETVFAPLYAPFGASLPPQSVLLARLARVTLHALSDVIALSPEAVGSDVLFSAGDEDADARYTRIVAAALAAMGALLQTLPPLRDAFAAAFPSAKRNPYAVPAAALSASLAALTTLAASPHPHIRKAVFLAAAQLAAAPGALPASSAAAVAPLWLLALKEQAKPTLHAAWALVLTLSRACPDVFTLAGDVRKRVLPALTIAFATPAAAARQAALPMLLSLPAELLRAVPDAPLRLCQSLWAATGLPLVSPLLPTVDRAHAQQLADGSLAPAPASVPALSAANKKGIARVGGTLADHVACISAALDGGAAVSGDDWRGALSALTECAVYAIRTSAHRAPDVACELFFSLLVPLLYTAVLVAQLALPRGLTALAVPLSLVRDMGSAVASALHVLSAATGHVVAAVEAPLQALSACALTLMGVAAAPRTLFASHLDNDNYKRVDAAKTLVQAVDAQLPLPAASAGECVLSVSCATVRWLQQLYSLAPHEAFPALPAAALAGNNTVLPLSTTLSAAGGAEAGVTPLTLRWGNAVTLLLLRETVEAIVAGVLCPGKHATTLAGHPAAATDEAPAVAVGRDASEASTPTLATTGSAPIASAPVLARMAVQCVALLLHPLSACALALYAHNTLMHQHLRFAGDIFSLATSVAVTPMATTSGLAATAADADGAADAALEPVCPAAAVRVVSADDELALTALSLCSSSLPALVDDLVALALTITDAPIPVPSADGNAAVLTALAPTLLMLPGTCVEALAAAYEPDFTLSAAAHATAVPYVVPTVSTSADVSAAVSVATAEATVASLTTALAGTPTSPRARAYLRPAAPAALLDTQLHALFALAAHAALLAYGPDSPALPALLADCLTFVASSSPLADPAALRAPAPRAALPAGQVPLAVNADAPALLWLLLLRALLLALFADKQDDATVSLCHLPTPSSLLVTLTPLPAHPARVLAPLHRAAKGSLALLADIALGLLGLLATRALFPDLAHALTGLLTLLLENDLLPAAALNGTAAVVADALVARATVETLAAPIHAAPAPVAPLPVLSDGARTHITLPCLLAPVLPSAAPSAPVPVPAPVGEAFAATAAAASGVPTASLSALVTLACALIDADAAGAHTAALQRALLRLTHACDPAVAAAAVAACGMSLKAPAAEPTALRLHTRLSAEALLAEAHQLSALARAWELHDNPIASVLPATADTPVPSSSSSSSSSSDTVPALSSWHAVSATHSLVPHIASLTRADRSLLALLVGPAPAWPLSRCPWRPDLQDFATHAPTLASTAAGLVTAAHALDRYGDAGVAAAAEPAWVRVLLALAPLPLLHCLLLAAQGHSLHPALIAQLHPGLPAPAADFAVSPALATEAALRLRVLITMPTAAIAHVGVHTVCRAAESTPRLAELLLALLSAELVLAHHSVSAPITASGATSPLSVLTPAHAPALDATDATLQPLFAAAAATSTRTADANSSASLTVASAPLSLPSVHAAFPALAAVAASAPLAGVSLLSLLVCTHYKTLIARARAYAHKQASTPLAPLQLLPTASSSSLDAAASAVAPARVFLSALTPSLALLLARAAPAHAFATARAVPDTHTDALALVIGVDALDVRALTTVYSAYVPSTPTVAAQDPEDGPLAALSPSLPVASALRDAILRRQLNAADTAISTLTARVPELLLHAHTLPVAVEVTLAANEPPAPALSAAVAAAVDKLASGATSISSAITALSLLAAAAQLAVAHPSFTLPAAALPALASTLAELARADALVPPALHGLPASVLTVHAPTLSALTVAITSAVTAFVTLAVHAPHALSVASPALPAPFADAASPTAACMFVAATSLLALLAAAPAHTTHASTPTAPHVLLAAALARTHSTSTSCLPYVPTSPFAPLATHLSSVATAAAAQSLAAALALALAQLPSHGVAVANVARGALSLCPRVSASSIFALLAHPSVPLALSLSPLLLAVTHAHALAPLAPDSTLAPTAASPGLLANTASSLPAPNADVDSWLYASSPAALAALTLSLAGENSSNSNDPTLALSAPASLSGAATRTALMLAAADKALPAPLLRMLLHRPALVSLPQALLAAPALASSAPTLAASAIATQLDVRCGPVAEGTIHPSLDTALPAAVRAARTATTPEALSLGYYWPGSDAYAADASIDFSVGVSGSAAALWPAPFTLATLPTRQRTQAFLLAWCVLLQTLSPAELRGDGRDLGEGVRAVLQALLVESGAVGHLLEEATEHVVACADEAQLSAVMRSVCMRLSMGKEEALESATTDEDANDGAAEDAEEVGSPLSATATNVGGALLRGVWSLVDAVVGALSSDKAQTTDSAATVGARVEAALGLQPAACAANGRVLPLSPARPRATQLDVRAVDDSDVNAVATGLAADVADGMLGSAATRVLDADSLPLPLLLASACAISGPAMFDDVNAVAARQPTAAAATTGSASAAGADACEWVLQLVATANALDEDEDTGEHGAPEAVASAGAGRGVDKSKTRVLIVTPLLARMYVDRRLVRAGTFIPLPRARTPAPISTAAAALARAFPPPTNTTALHALPIAIPPAVETPMMHPALAWVVLARTLLLLPAAAQQWYRRLPSTGAAAVASAVSVGFSPLVVATDLLALRATAAATPLPYTRVSCASAHTRTALGVVTARFDREGAQAVLQVSLPRTHPLDPPAVSVTTTMTGLATAATQKWKHAAVSALSSNKGSLHECARVWALSVGQQLEGVEECGICMSLVHDASHALPKMRCDTCQHLFHNACLLTWFNTSGKSSCPMCRQLF